MANYIVCLDAGHGGSDPGASYGKLIEKQIVLIVTLTCRNVLIEHGVQVVLTRSTDTYVGLSQRAQIANLAKAIYFVSIHCNAGKGDRGEVISSIYRGKGLQLSNNIAKEMKAIGQDVVKEYTKKGSGGTDYYAVIRETNMDAVIVECAFLDNEIDNKIIDTVKEQELFGIAIAKGILKQCGIKYKENNVSYKPVQLPTDPSKLYRIRKSWKDASSQKGAYSIKENAIAECKKHSGYNVYDSHGNSVYSSGGTQSRPEPTPSQKPSKEKIDLFSRVAVKGRGLNYYDWVKNLEDYTGDMKNPCCLFMAYQSKGEVRFRVTPISEGRYYSEVQNYYSSKGNYDEAGLPNVPFDKIQMRFDLPGYKIRYRAMCNGRWLDWVENCNSYMEGHNGYAGLGDGTPITAIECEIVLDN